jgi:hypothetical protein
MDINFSNIDVNETRRLGKCLETGIVDINSLRKYFDGLQRKINTSASPRSRSSQKPDRKDNYKTKLKVA